MIEWTLQNDFARIVSGTVIVRLPVSTPGGRSRYTVEASGDGADLITSAVEEVKKLLSNAPSFRGHTIGEACTGSELHEVMLSRAMAGYAPRVTAGEELTIAPPSLTTANIAASEAQGLRT
jgi:hypothetical protein